MNVQEFRKKYPSPDYDKFSDRELADKVYEKFYKDQLDKSEFDKRFLGIGAEQAPTPKSETPPVPETTPTPEAAATPAPKTKLRKAGASSEPPRTYTDPIGHAVRTVSELAGKVPGTATDVRQGAELVLEKLAGKDVNLGDLVPEAIKKPFVKMQEDYVREKGRESRLLTGEPLGPSSIAQNIVAPAVTFPLSLVQGLGQNIAGMVGQRDPLIPSATEMGKAIIDPYVEALFKGNWEPLTEKLNDDPEGVFFDMAIFYGVKRGTVKAAQSAKMKIKMKRQLAKERETAKVKEQKFDEGRVEEILIESGVDPTSVREATELLDKVPAYKRRGDISVDAQGRPTGPPKPPPPPPPGAGQGPKKTAPPGAPRAAPKSETTQTLEAAGRSQRRRGQVKTVQPKSHEPRPPTEVEVRPDTIGRAIDEAFTPKAGERSILRKPPPKKVPERPIPPRVEGKGKAVEVRTKGEVELDIGEIDKTLPPAKAPVTPPAKPKPKTPVPPVRLPTKKPTEAPKPPEAKAPESTKVWDSKKGWVEDTSAKKELSPVDRGDRTGPIVNEELLPPARAELVSPTEVTPGELQQMGLLKGEKPGVGGADRLSKVKGGGKKRGVKGKKKIEERAATGKGLKGERGAIGVRKTAREKQLDRAVKRMRKAADKGVAADKGEWRKELDETLAAEPVPVSVEKAPPESPPTEVPQTVSTGLASSTRRAQLLTQDTASLTKTRKALNVSDNYGKSVNTRLKQVYGIKEWKNATPDQLSSYITAVEQLQKGDRFLTDAQLKGAESYLKDYSEPRLVTQREFTERFKETTEAVEGAIVGKVPMSTLPTVTIKEGSKVVRSVVDKADLELRGADRRVREVKETIDHLMKEAERTRPPRTKKRKVGRRIFEAMSGKEVHPPLTPAETSAANFLKAYYERARETLDLKKYRQHYITHIKPKFWERLVNNKYDLKKTLDSYRTPQGELPIDTLLAMEDIIGSEKFFQFALPRKGGRMPSKDIRQIISTYAEIAENKIALDRILPEGQMATHLLLQKHTAVWLKDWLQNLKGRGRDWKGRQGPGKWAYKIGDKVVDVGYIRLLGGNIGSGIKNILGGEANSVIYQGFTQYATGKARLLTNPVRAHKRISDAGLLDGSYIDIIRPTFVRKSQKVIDNTLYGFMKAGEYEMRGSMFLGELTKAEWKTGEIAPQRFRKILDDIGMTQGIYTKVDSPLFTQGVVGRSIMQFSRWKLTNALLARKLLKGAKKEWKSGSPVGPNTRSLLKMMTIFSTGTYLMFEAEKAGYKEAAKYLQPTTELVGVFKEALGGGMMDMVMENPAIQTGDMAFYSLQNLLSYTGLWEPPEKVRYRRGLEDAYWAIGDLLGSDEEEGGREGHEGR